MESRRSLTLLGGSFPLHLSIPLDYSKDRRDEEVSLHREPAPRLQLIGLNAGSKLAEKHTDCENEELLAGKIPALERKPSPSNHLRTHHDPEKHLVLRVSEMNLDVRVAKRPGDCHDSCLSIFTKHMKGLNRGGLAHGKVNASRLLRYTNTPDTTS